MTQTFHDFIIIEPEISKGVLQTRPEDIHTGIVKEFGTGYWSDSGSRVDQIPIQIGDKILFTQCLKFDLTDEEIFVTRGRDVIQVSNDKS